MKHFADVFLKQALTRFDEVERDDPGQPCRDLLSDRCGRVSPVLSAEHGTLNGQHQWIFRRQERGQVREILRFVSSHDEWSDPRQR